MNKTCTPKKAEIKGKWYLIDAQDKVLGRLATQIAAILRGKHRPDFTPNLCLEDHIVVINAEKVKLTGNKLLDKKYNWHTGYVGGIKEITAEKLLQKKPTEVLRKAVKGMLPHNKLGRELLKNLRLFEGAEHDHQAQNPEPYEV